MQRRSLALFSLRQAAFLAALVLSACTLPRSTPSPSFDPQTLLPADAILLGEQHDAAEHQAIHAQVVRQLAARSQLAALALEMAEQGRSTQGLATTADETLVRRTLQWHDEAWPWAAYGPAVMAAVRAGVPVLGANLPRADMRPAMQDGALDERLPPPALRTQQAAIRTGHCGLLPESQIAPMARIQIARDLAMARIVQAAVRPGQVVVLLAGSGHVDRTLGVPRHLPAGLQARAVLLRAGAPASASEATPAFDRTWGTPPVPAKDHCADLRRQLQR
jgi:uncharacterized iron-regulated protein